MIRTVEGTRVVRKRDLVAVEEPLEIQLRAGGERQVVAITMRTPGNDYELAAGFLYTEAIVSAKHEIDHMIYCVDGETTLQEYNALAVSLRTAALPELPGLDRHFFTNSACGVCGRTMLDELDERRLPPLDDNQTVAPDVLTTLPAALRQAQQIFDATGGLHAAALFTQTGELLALREDVGRHNALDKLIGWGLLQGHFFFFFFFFFFFSHTPSPPPQALTISLPRRRWRCIRMTWRPGARDGGWPHVNRWRGGDQDRGDRTFAPGHGLL